MNPATFETAMKSGSPAAWAELFVETVRDHPEIVGDMGAMCGWFLNAQRSVS